ncbi:MAG: hypothetical protein LGB54_05185 [Sulfurovum sp.]|nr:hypothetical protein [Sulfurovum sp.]
MFQANIKTINSNITIHIIDIDSFNNELIQFIDEHFVTICEGDSGSNLEQVKKLVIGFLTSKDTNTKMGATAEFFLHLYLKFLGYKQECLYLNLEERSIKKGFDGYYSIDREEYIMESKSGSINTSGISHPNKIEEAYKDLKNSLVGTKSKNNPWKNAYNHASHVDVGTAKNIRKNIKKLSDEFNDGSFHEIKNFNIIPASTIFLDGIWHDDYSKDIIDELESLSHKFEFTKLNIICITQQSLKLFEEYLEKN